MNTKTTKLSQISNAIFFASIIFCLFFLWCNYYIKSIKISFISSIIVFVAFLVIYVPIKNLFTKKKTKSKLELESFNNFKLQLQLSQCDCIVNLLKSYLQISSHKKLNSNHYLINNSFDLFICTEENLEPTKIYNCIQNRVTNKIKVLTLEPLTIPFELKNVEIEVINSEQIYKYSKDNNINTLEQINLKKKQKYRLKDIICVVLCKEKSKNYWWLGFLLLFSSLFTPFSTYYIIFSTILFVLALVSRFDFIFKSKNN